MATTPSTAPTPLSHAASEHHALHKDHDANRIDKADEQETLLLLEHHHEDDEEEQRAAAELRTRALSFWLASCGQHAELQLYERYTTVGPSRCRGLYCCWP